MKWNKEQLAAFDKQIKVIEKAYTGYAGGKRCVDITAGCIFCEVFNAHYVCEGCPINELITKLESTSCGSLIDKITDGELDFFSGHFIGGSINVVWQKKWHKLRREEFQQLADLFVMMRGMGE